MRPRSASLALLLGVAMLLPSTGIVLASRVDRGADAPVTLDAKLRRIALGVSVRDGRQVSRLADFSASIGGQTPATWTIWSQWGDPSTRDFPTQAASRASERGATPLIFWEPIDPNDLSSPLYARHANISSGRHDEYIRSFAREAKRFGSPVIVRFAQEANGGFFPWGVSGFDNTAASFVAAWRHVHRIFQDVGASNVKFLWSVSKKGCSKDCNPYAPFFPGDAYVDYVGFSSFNWGAQRGQWVSMLKGYRRVTNLLAKLSSKPIIAVESATNGQGGNKAAWIREGYRAVYADLPRISAIIYLNVDLRAEGHPDWRIGSPAAALDAYAEVAAMPEFQGKLPGG